MPNLNIAFIQTNIIWENKTANFHKIETSYFEKLKGKNIDLILLPEMFATGFTMQPELFWENESGPTYEWLKKWSNQLKSSIGAGIITKDNEGYKNTFIVFHPDGQSDFYHKRHLFRMGEENKHYSRGTTPSIININGWSINLQVCYDLRFPSFARNKIVNEYPAYDLLLYIANWPEVRTYAWTNLLRSRAIENQAFTIGVNRVGNDINNISHSGESACIDPLGNYILDPVLNTEGIYTVSLDKSVLENARKKFPVLLDADKITITD